MKMTVIKMSQYTKAAECATEHLNAEIVMKPPADRQQQQQQQHRKQGEVCDQEDNTAT